jgi:hypothetical protein
LAKDKACIFSLLSSVCCARTHLALIMKIEMIGREEGVNPDFIKKEIQRIGHEETGRPN